jgi:hypothetical protein
MESNFNQNDKKKEREGVSSRNFPDMNIDGNKGHHSEIAPQPLIQCLGNINLVAASAGRQAERIYRLAR